jgi:hypothetical protein
MREDAAARKKKEEIKLQIGKRGRRRKKALMREKGAQGGGGSADDGVEEVPLHDYEFEVHPNYGVVLLRNGRLDMGGSGKEQALELLDSPTPSLGYYRCPVKDVPAHPKAEKVSGSSGSVRSEGQKGVMLSPGSRVSGPPSSQPQPIAARGERGESYNVPSAEPNNVEGSRKRLYDKMLFGNAFSASRFSDPYLSTPMSLDSGAEVSLIKHYIRHSFPQCYQGMAELDRHRCLREGIVPMLCSNPSFLKGCMSNSALHMSLNMKDRKQRKTLLEEGSKHMISCTGELGRKLARGGNLEETLATVLTLVTFEVYTFPLTFLSSRF